jgi:hypothetical protein
LQLFYAVGTKQSKNKKTGEIEWVNVRIANLPNDRLGAVNVANRVARQEKIKLDGVFMVQNPEKKGEILTKNMMNQKIKRR